MGKYNDYLILFGRRFEDANGRNYQRKF